MGKGKGPGLEENGWSAVESNGAGQRFSQAGLCAGTARLAAGYGSGDGCVASGRGRGLWFLSRATKVKRPLVTRTSSRLRPRVAMTSIRIATDEIGREHVCTSVTNPQIVCRIQLDKRHTVHYA